MRSGSGTAPSTVFTGGPIYTQTASQPTAEAIGVRDGRIAAVGSRQEVTAAMGVGASVYELDGGALLPGFIDAHHHFAFAALDYGSPDFRLEGKGTVADLLELIRAAVEKKPPEGWIYLCGYELANIREKRPPNADELEECCPGRPLFFQAANGHQGCLNRTGLLAAGWDDRSPDPPNGKLHRNRRGRLTGEVREAATFYAEAKFRDQLLEDGADVWLQACRAHGEDLLAHGITRVGDAAVAASVERLYQRGAREGVLPIPVHPMPVASDNLLRPRFDGLPTGAGEPEAPIGPAKLFLDGGHRCAICLDFRQVGWIASRMAQNVFKGQGLAVLRALASSGAPRLGRDLHIHVGMRVWEREALRDAVGHGAERGFQIAQHALGNEAIDFALESLRGNERALAAAPGHARLEHVVFASDEQARQIADTGAVAVMQPGFIAAMGDEMLLTPMPPPIETMPLRTLDEAGVELAGSSDYPVTPYPVLPAIAAALTRRTAQGELLAPEQAIDLATALRAYTVGSAKALGVENEVGSLTVGRRADLVHLARDPFAVDPERLGDIPIASTWVNGERAFSSESISA